MSKIAIRGYTQRHIISDEGTNGSHRFTPLTHDRVFVFDTETTVDHYQNLKIGYFKVYQSGYLQQHGLFYDPSMLDEKETQILKTYAESEGIPLYDVGTFIEAVFYPEVFSQRALCVGFNLAFDLSRLAYDVGQSRKQNLGGFTLHLSAKQWNPPIIIKKLGSSHAM